MPLPDASAMQNFGTSIAEAQLPPEQLYTAGGSLTPLKQTLDTINLGFTAVFTVELCINLFSHWLWDFLSNSWSVFDLVVVGMSLIVLGPLAESVLDTIPITIVRSLRALRVSRLFGRLQASKKILAALSASIVPMCNAFFIMLIVAMLCAL